MVEELKYLLEKLGKLFANISPKHLVTMVLFIVGKPRELYETHVMFVAGYWFSADEFVDAMLGKDEDGYYALIDETRFTLLEERFKVIILMTHRQNCSHKTPEDRVNKKNVCATIPLELAQ